MITGLAKRLPRRAWHGIFRKTLLMMGVSIVVSVVATIYFMGTMSQGVDMPGLMISIIMPICLGGPMILMFVIGGEKMRFANQQLSRLASVDGLTDLLNRRAFTAEVEARCAVPRSRGTLLVLDVDHFKSVNDTFGHDRGDEALVKIATALTRATGMSGIVGRLGGEEFGIYLPRIGLDEAALTASRVRTAIGEIDFAPDGVAYALSVSIGGAAHGAPISFREIYHQADQFLYQAKQRGRDRVSLPQAA